MNHIPRGRTANPSPPVQVNPTPPRGAQPTPPPQSVFVQGRPDGGYGGYPAPVSYRQVPPSTSPHDMNKQPIQPNQPQLGQQAMYMSQQTMRPAFYNPAPRQPMAAPRQHRPMNMNSQPPQQFQPQMQMGWNQNYIQQPQTQTYMMYPPQQQISTAQQQYISQQNTYRIPNTPPYYTNTQPQQVFFQQSQMQPIQTTNAGRPQTQPPYIQQQQQQPVKRERKPLLIVNPDTGKSINEELTSAHSSKSNTPPVSDSSERATPNAENRKEVQAQFAAQVIETILPKSTADTINTPAAAQPDPAESEDSQQPPEAATEVQDSTDSNSGQPSAPADIAVNVIEATPPQTVNEESVTKAAEVTVQPDFTEPEPVSESAADVDAAAAAPAVVAETEVTPQEQNIVTEVPQTEEKQEEKAVEVPPPVENVQSPPQTDDVDAKTEIVEVQKPSAVETNEANEVSDEKVSETQKPAEVPEEAEKSAPCEPETKAVPNGKKITEKEEAPVVTEINVSEKTENPKEVASANGSTEVPLPVDTKQDKAPADITNQVPARKDKEDIKYKYREGTENIGISAVQV